MSRYSKWIALSVLLFGSTLAFVFPTTKCFADEFSDAKTLWTKLGFYGSPVTPYPEPKVEDYLNYDRATCGKMVERLVALGDKYRNHALTSSSTQGDMKAIHSFLFQEIGTGNICFPTVSKAYILESILIKDPTYLVYQRDNIPISKDQLSEFKPGSPVTFMTAAALINAGRIEALTPALRTQLGSGWDAQIGKPQKFSSAYTPTLRTFC